MYETVLKAILVSGYFVVGKSLSYLKKEKKNCRKR